MTSIWLPGKASDGRHMLCLHTALHKGAELESHTHTFGGEVKGGGAAACVVTPVHCLLPAMPHNGARQGLRARQHWVWNNRWDSGCMSTSFIIACMPQVGQWLHEVPQVGQYLHEHQLYHRPSYCI